MTQQRKPTYAEKVAHAKARMQALGIEPITTRAWKPAISHVTREAAPKTLPKTVTNIRKRKP